MKKYLVSLATVAFAFIGIVNYDALTNTYARVQDGTIEPRLTQVYTDNKGKYFQSAHDRDLEILKTSYAAAFLCASKKDVSKCRTADPNLAAKQ